MTYEVEMCVRLNVTVRVEAGTNDEAEEQAHEEVTAMLPHGCEVTYQEIHRTRRIP